MEGAPNENIAKKVRDEALEIALFGISLEDASPLRELYKYFSNEQMSEIAIQLDFNWGDFHVLKM